MIGEKTCIVPINDNLSATITDSNTVEIGSGVCITKEGRRVQIDEGDIEEIIIPTGTQGVDTYYIIGFHLYINESGQQVAETFVETMASATDTITETTFKEGSSSIYVSLYRVKRSGLLMESVTQIIPTLKTIVDINDTIGSTDISGIGDGTVTGGLSQLNSDLLDKAPIWKTVGTVDNVPLSTITITLPYSTCAGKRVRLVGYSGMFIVNLNMYSGGSNVISRMGSVINPTADYKSGFELSWTSESATLCTIKRYVNNSGAAFNSPLEIQVCKDY